MRNADALLQAFDSTYGLDSLAKASVGKLNPEQADRFINFITDNSVLKNSATTIKMNASERRIPVASLSKKPLRPFNRGVANGDPGVTATAGVTEVVLNTKTVVAEGTIYDEELEDNVEGADFQTTFMELLSKQIANQLEDVCLHAVSTNGAPTPVDLLQQFNGWKYAATNGGHTVDFGAATSRNIDTTKLSQLIKKMPAQYRRMNAGLRMFVSPDLMVDITDLVGNRNTPFGDQAFKADSPGIDARSAGDSGLGWGRIPFSQVPLLSQTDFVPVAGAGAASTTVSSGGAAGTNTVTVAAIGTIVAGDYIKVGTGGTAETLLVSSVATNTITTATNFAYGHSVGETVVRGTADGTYILLTYKENLLLGIQRDVKVELERRAREQAWYVVVSMRADIQALNRDAMAIATSLAIK